MPTTGKHAAEVEQGFVRSDVGRLAFQYVALREQEEFGLPAYHRNFEDAAFTGSSRGDAVARRRGRRGAARGGAAGARHGLISDRS